MNSDHLRNIRIAAMCVLTALQACGGGGDGGDRSGMALQADGKIIGGGLARNDVDGYGAARINP
jgi:hypothetical protein